MCPKTEPNSIQKWQVLAFLGLVAFAISKMALVWSDLHTGGVLKNKIQFHSVVLRRAEVSSAMVALVIANTALVCKCQVDGQIYTQRNSRYDVTVIVL